MDREGVTGAEALHTLWAEASGTFGNGLVEQQFPCEQPVRRAT